jgi:hypothetical protein
MQNFLVGATIIGRKTKLDMMLKVEGECEFYSCPLFP